MEKKKLSRKSISLEIKISILDRLANGEGSTAIGKHLHLGESTIRAIKKNEETIRNSVITGTKLSTKLSSYSRDTLIEKMEQILLIWIEELNEKRIPISRCLLRQRAIQVYEQIKKLEPSASHTNKFSASKKWLTRFTKRNSIHNVKIKDEDADEEADRYISKIIDGGGYCPDHTEETGLSCTKMGTRSYIVKPENKASAFMKEQVRLFLCTNALGNKMIKQEDRDTSRSLQI